MPEESNAAASDDVWCKWEKAYFPGSQFRYDPEFGNIHEGKTPPHTDEGHRLRYGPIHRTYRAARRAVRRIR